MSEESAGGAVPDVVTSRLRLVSLSLPVLEALLAGDVGRAAARSGVAIDEEGLVGAQHVLRLRHAQLLRDPGEQPWLLRAVVLRGTTTVVGRIGFHAPPDPRGEVEIGYEIWPGHRRRGYALEAARSLLDWAAQQGARRCLASVAPGNTASLALAARLSFTRIGQQVDEVDGLEHVFAVDLAPILPRVTSVTALAVPADRGDDGDLGWGELPEGAEAAAHRYAEDRPPHWSP